MQSWQPQLVKGEGAIASSRSLSEIRLGAAGRSFRLDFASLYPSRCVIPPWLCVWPSARCQSQPFLAVSSPSSRLCGAIPNWHRWTAAEREYSISKEKHNVSEPDFTPPALTSNVPSWHSSAVWRLQDSQQITDIWSKTNCWIVCRLTTTRGTHMMFDKSAQTDPLLSGLTPIISISKHLARTLHLLCLPGCAKNRQSQCEAVQLTRFASFADHSGDAPDICSCSFERGAASAAHRGNKAASDLHEIFICGDEVRAFWSHLPIQPSCFLLSQAGLPGVRFTI